MDLDAGSGQRRRRGEELEDALLEATWAELTEHGYGALTIDAVAQRAGTSRPVIYRRWGSKQELVRAAIVWTAKRDQVAMPDTGTLRGDVLALMRYGNEHRIGLAGLMVVYLGGYFQETGTSPADLRELIMGERPPVMDAVIARAVERGEVDPARLTRRVRDLPFDLLRHEALMRLRPVPDESIVAIVDDIFLPLATGSVASDA